MISSKTPAHAPRAVPWPSLPTAGPLVSPRPGLSMRVEGRRSPAELQRLAQALRLGPAAVDLLASQGRLELPAGERQGWASPAVDDAKLRALAATSAYAMELAYLMLGRQADELLALAAAIRSRAALLDWCERCTEAIASQAGGGRAAEFRGLMRQRLADGLAADLD